MSWRDSTDWQRLGDVVASFKRKVEAAYHACDDDAAGQAHDDLTAVEWRLRQAERSRDRG